MNFIVFFYITARFKAGICIIINDLIWDMCSHLEPAYGDRERVEKKADNYEEPILESDFVSSPPKGDEIILNVYFNC